MSTKKAVWVHNAFLKQAGHREDSGQEWLLRMEEQAKVEAEEEEQSWALGRLQVELESKLEVETEQGAELKVERERFELPDQKRGSPLRWVPLSIQFSLPEN